MKFVKSYVTAMLALCIVAPSALADRGDFNFNKMMGDLESELKLSDEKLSELKPVVEAKSEELKQSINESVEKGFMQLESLSSELDAASKEAEEKLKEALDSEEMQQLKDYMNKIDGDAISQIREELVKALTEFLKLTEDQITKLKPVLEDGFDELGGMLDRLAKEGNKSVEEFKKEYGKLSKELDQKLKDTLDSDQIKSLDTHQDELRENIKGALYSS